MILEVNENFVDDQDGLLKIDSIKNKDLKTFTQNLRSKGFNVMVTPNIDEDFWWFRVQVSDMQAIVALPKFGLIGIGFQIEEDWNTNLPSDTIAEEIYDLIAQSIDTIIVISQYPIDAISCLKSF